VAGCSSAHAPPKKVLIKLGVEPRTRLDRVLSNRPTDAVNPTSQLGVQPRRLCKVQEETER